MTPAQIVTLVQNFEMSPLTVVLFVSLALAEIQPGSAGMMIPHTTRNTIKAWTTEEPVFGIISYAGTTIRAPTTKEPIFGVVHRRRPQKSQCLNLKERCIESDLFCCKSQKLDNREIVHVDGFCNVFSERCESRISFHNYDAYVARAREQHKSLWERLNP